MLRRRDLMLGGLCLPFVPAFAAEAAPTAVVFLWPGMPPGGGGPAGTSHVKTHGVVTEVARPTLEVFAADRPLDAVMVIAGGGGYRRIGDGSAARPAAHWFARRGISACVLNYRLPSEGWTLGPLAPLQDAQRALRLIRAGRVAGIAPPRRIGVMGFSAGGHLMGMTAAHSARASYPSVDAADDQPLAVELAVLASPVITLTAPSHNTSTYHVLLGPHPTAEAERRWSVETHVTRRCPPVFMVQAADDRISDPANTLLMQQACERAGVPVARHLFRSGGHGFGLGRPGTVTEDWADRLLVPWAAQQGFPL